MKIKTKARAGGLWTNRNATKTGMKIRTKIRAGGLWSNHNASKMVHPKTKIGR
jgi:hypothetical protein